MTKEEEITYEENGIVPDHIDERKLAKNRIMAPSASSDRDGGADRYGKRSREAIGYGGSVDQASVAVILLENEGLKVKLVEVRI